MQLFILGLFLSASFTSLVVIVEERGKTVPIGYYVIKVPLAELLSIMSSEDDMMCNAITSARRSECDGSLQKAAANCWPWWNCN